MSELRTTPVGPFSSRVSKPMRLAARVTSCALGLFVLSIPAVWSFPFWPGWVAEWAGISQHWAELARASLHQIALLTALVAFVFMLLTKAKEERRRGA